MIIGPKCAVLHEVPTCTFLRLPSFPCKTLFSLTNSSEIILGMLVHHLPRLLVSWISTFLKKHLSFSMNICFLNIDFWAISSRKWVRFSLWPVTHGLSRKIKPGKKKRLLHSAAVWRWQESDSFGPACLVELLQRSEKMKMCNVLSMGLGTLQ